MGHVLEFTTEQLSEQRAALLAKTGMTWSRLVELATAYALEADERNIYESICAIDYLLGEDDHAA